MGFPESEEVNAPQAISPKLPAYGDHKSLGPRPKGSADADVVAGEVIETYHYESTQRGLKSRYALGVLKM